MHPENIPTEITDWGEDEEDVSVNDVNDVTTKIRVIYDYFTFFFRFSALQNHQQSRLTVYLYLHSVLIFRAPTYTVCANSNTTRILIQLRYMETRLL